MRGEPHIWDSLLLVAGWLTLDEAAEYLGVSKPTVHRWCRDEGLPYYPTGFRGRRFLQKDLDDFLGQIGAGRRQEGSQRSPSVRRTQRRRGPSVR